MNLTPYTPNMATAEIGALTGLLITGFPEREYHARREVSSHNLGDIRNAPRKYWHRKQFPKPPTKAMQDGTAMHVMLFESPRFCDVVATVPGDAPKKPSSAQRAAAKPAPATIDAIAWWDRFHREGGDRIILDAEEVEEMRQRCAAIHADTDAALLLRESIATEVSVFWRDPETNVPRRARMDRLRAGNIIVDLKTTVCASAESFGRTAISLRYYSQAADYCDAMELLTGEPWSFWWIAAESEPPWLCPVYQCPPEGIDLGRIGRKAGLEVWQAATASGIWPGYQSKPSQLIPPIWALKEVGL